MVSNQTRSPRERYTSRRTALRLTGGAVVAGLAGCLSVPTSGDRESDEWRSLGRDAANAGSTQTCGPDGPNELWRVDSPRFSTSPVVADGVVYAGAVDETLYALDAATGERLWTYPVHGPLYYAPTVADDAIYVAAADAVHAVATDGDEVWTHDLEGDLEARSACTVRNGRVHVSTSARLLALDADSGDELWHGEGNGLFSTPAVAEHTVYAFGSVAEFDDDGEWAGSQTGAVALDAETGAERWRYDGGDEQVPQPAHGPSIDDERVYAGTWGAESERLVALDRSSGDEAWRATLPGIATHPPVVDGDTVYVGVSAAADTATLRLLETDDHPIDADSLGSVVAVDAETGDRRWDRGLDDPGAAVAVGSETLYCRTFGSLVTFDRDDGTRRWTYDSEFGLPWDPDDEESYYNIVDGMPQPAVVDGTAFVTTPAGGAYALGED